MPDTASAVAEGYRQGGLQRVTLRLAAQTVALLLVMLVTLEVVVYLITQQALLGSLQATLRDRVNGPPDTICYVYRAGCENQGVPEENPGRGPFPPRARRFPPLNAARGPSEASRVYIDPELHILHADGAVGAVVLAPSDARRTLATGRAQCCSSESYGEQHFLVYTAPVPFGGKIIGAVQASISEHQYEGTMESLLRALLVVALLGLLISGGISAILVHRTLEPIRVAVQRQRDFVADAAHELRTPLAIQRTVGEVGLAEASTEELQSTVAQMLGQNQHLTRLVDDLSLLARTDTNTVRIDRRPVHLSSLVSETSTELGYLAEEQGVALQAEVQGNVRVVGDVLRLRQLLLILLDNGLKHTPAGGTISVQLAAQGGRARLRVADSGPGIDPSALPRIFDRFYRADHARTGEGSGLGLAIGKWIVEAHGGHIEAGNLSPHGAAFTVTLPAARLPAA